MRMIISLVVLTATFLGLASTPTTGNQTVLGSVRSRAFPQTNQNNSEQVRLNQLFNFGWKFKAGEVANAQSLTFDDSDWRKLDLPHDFQIEQPWDKAASRGRGFKAMGIGWYRKTFKADPNWMGKRILLDFEGIMLSGEVWLNGKKVGGTEYGYLGFESDIADIIKYDADNVVAVRASTGENGNSRWYTGGGLFRDVRLVVKDKISIARHGVFISTPGVSEQNAEVSIQVEVAGIKNQQLQLEIRTKIFSPTGKQVADTKTLAPQKSKLAEIEVHLPKLNVSSPQLWSCETPNLYAAEVSLVLNGKVIDQVTEKFGIRTIEFSKEAGFKLNGKKVFLKGVANHHDLGAVGAAAYETSIARMMEQLKAFGFNHIRTSHNPYSKAFMKLADEKGILVVDELYDKWGSTVAWAGSVPWNDVWYKNLKEWIKRDRNHPSVILWSFGNELQFQEERWNFPTSDWGVTTYRIMVVVAKRYDPTRKTTVAMYPARAGGIIKADPDFKIKENIAPPELARVTDVASFNYVWDDYQEYLKHAPDMIIYQSEAVTNELAAPYFGMDRDKMVGLAYWGGIEYWGESQGWPTKGWNYSFFNHSLEPNPQAYLIKSIFKDEPLVQIGIVDSEAESHVWNDVVVGRKYISSHWNREDGKKYDLYTYTNAEEVELLVNEKTIGVQQNSTDVKKRNVIFWKNIPFTAGKITAIARTGGKEVARHELETTGKATAIKIETENSEWKADGMDLQYVRVYAVDSKGRKVPTATGELTFEVTGAGRLIAVDNGDHSSDDLFAGNKKSLHRGFAMAILRSEQTAGAIKLKVTAVGLKGMEQTIIAK
jgi:beta-galactosidase